jgi:pyruvate,water dikinase
MMMPYENYMSGLDYTSRFRYETLRSLLDNNVEALRIMSDLEADLNHLHRFDDRIIHTFHRLTAETLLMAQGLNLLTENRYTDLYQTIFRIKNETDLLLKPEESSEKNPLVLMIDFSESPDMKQMGGKTCGIWNLGKYLPDSVPQGFVVTTAAYRMFLEQNNLHHRIPILLNNLDVTVDQDQFRSRTQTIRRWIRDAHVPDEITSAIHEFADLIKVSQTGLLWAVRSSATYEDGNYSFAGQFDSCLNIDTKNLISAYLDVLAGRFTDRAVKYRIHMGFREIKTPMAVLFMPMIDPIAAGVLYTTDLKDPQSNLMIVNAVPGLADKMVRGEESADVFYIRKGPVPEIFKTVPASGGAETDTLPAYISQGKLVELSRLGMEATEKSGSDLDIEWAMDRDGKIWLLQARSLEIIPLEMDMGHSWQTRKKLPIPLLEKGITIFPGRAEGPVYLLKNGSDLSLVPKGAVVVADNPTPEMAEILPRIAAFLAKEGNPVGHLATLTREFSVPSIFRIGKNANILSREYTISINATERKIYKGSIWPGMQKRVFDRIKSVKQHHKSGPLYDLVLKLNLLDPTAPSFKSKSCQSIHDTLRFMHEISVREMFGFGDQQNGVWKKKSRKLITDLPFKFRVIDLDGSIAKDSRKILPEDIGSVPFQALWRGISDKRLSWPNRWEGEMVGLPPAFRKTVLGGGRGPRRPTDTNYAIVARDYINLNARVAYHYTMVDAMIGPGSENNHIHYRFRGGGGNKTSLKRRARFLEIILRNAGYGVERRGDLITAWFTKYPKLDSEKALETLGRLMVCARQLDSVLKSDSDTKHYADCFLKEKFSIFS